jgi:2-(3-amino-3-carboxypropyl)histidine synthase
MYDLEIERVSEEIRRRGASTVLLQIPDGLRPQAFALAESLRRWTSTEIVISGDSCYGACDVAISQARALVAELLVHYGHNRMISETDPPVIYVEAKMEYDARALVEKALPLIRGWSRVGLMVTVQGAHLLGDVSDALKQSGVHVAVGEGAGRTPDDGQILGCDYTTALSVQGDVDGYLFVGAGRFHPIGLTISTGLPVALANPYTMKVEMLDDAEVMRLAKKRMAQITGARRAKRLGVIVSLKPGQRRLELARSLKNRLEEAGLEAHIVALDEVSATTLGNFTEAEAYINTACPRISLDGVADIKKPMLTPSEALVMLGDLRWEEVWGKTYFR